MPIVIFLIGIAAGAVSPLSSSHAPSWRPESGWNSGWRDLR